MTKRDVKPGEGMVYFIGYLARRIVQIKAVILAAEVAFLVTAKVGCQSCLLTGGSSRYVGKFPFKYWVSQKNLAKSHKKILKCFCLVVLHNLQI